MKIIFLFLFILSCATAITGQLRLQDRELLIHPDKNMLAYPHVKTICTPRNRPWRWLGEKCKEVQTIDEYPLNAENRKTLRAAGFTCKSNMRFRY